MYTNKGEPNCGLFRIGGVASNSFSWSKFSWHVAFSNLADFLSRFIIGLVLSASLRRKRVMVVSRPTSLCTSLTLVGLRMLMMAWHRFALMPRRVNMNPRNLPLSTPKVHFSGLRRKLYLHMALKTSARSKACWVGLGDLTTMSSTYTSTLLPSRGLKILSISLW